MRTEKTKVRTYKCKECPKCHKQAYKPTLLSGSKNRIMCCEVCDHREYIERD